MDGSIVNSTKGFMGKKLWKTFLNETNSISLACKNCVTLPMRHRPTDCRLQAAGEGVKQLDNKLVVWRTSNMEIQQAKDSR
jgi:hypothetical protein